MASTEPQLKIIDLGTDEPSPAVQRLAELYELLASDKKNPASREWNKEAGELVANILESKDWAALDHLTDHLASLEESDPIQCFYDDIEDVASHRPLDLTDPNSKYVTLFAIPLIARSDLPLNVVDANLERTADFENFVKSISEFDLPEVPAKLDVLPYLYSPAEIQAITPVRVWHLSPQIAKMLEGTLSLTPDELGQMNVTMAKKRFPGEEDEHIGLRYLLGAAVAERVGTYFEDASSFELDISDEEYEQRQEVYDERTTRWCKAATDLLSTILSEQKGSKVDTIVQPISPIFEAYRGGLSGLSNFCVISGIDTVLPERSLFHQEAWAAIAPFGNNGFVEQLRFSLLTKDSDSFIYGFVRDIHDHENAEDIALDLAEVFKDMGLCHVQLVSEIEPINEYGDEPIFVAPNHPEGFAANPSFAKQTIPKHRILH